MGSPISVVFSDLYVSKMKEDIVAPMKPLFYKRYVDGIFIRRKKNEPDSLFEKLNSSHTNIKFTIEKNPTKFLDTEIIRHGCEIGAKSANVGVSLLYGLILASLRINQIYIKTDQVQVKPYLHQNHSTD